MFNKLRMRLVLLNVAVSGLIVIVIAVIACILISGNIEQQSQQMLRMLSTNIAMQAGSSEVDANILAKLMGGLYPYFAVEVGDKGESVISNFRTELSEDTMLATVKSILADEANMAEQKSKSEDGAAQKKEDASKAAEGKAAGPITNMAVSPAIELDGRWFRYSEISARNGASYMIFLDISEEKALLGKVVLALSVCAAVGLAMVFFGGLFLAGRSIKPIRTAWQKQRDFVADASHELRSPLAALRISLDAVLSRPESTIAERRDFLDGMGEEMSGMARLVDDMLLIARADSDAVIFAGENVNFARTAESAFLLMRPVAEKKGISCTLDIQAAPLVRGDGERLKQVVLILLDNAIKYTPEGGSIQCALKFSHEKVIFEISDTGIGIQKEYLQAIFERFYRVDRARSRESGGQGLGLSIAKWIVEKHRGVITVHSEPGAGSIFTITLPEA